MGSSFCCEALSVEERQAYGQGSKLCPLLAAYTKAGEQGPCRICVPPSGYKGPGGILVVGEAPGQEEDRCGEPFVGKSGDLLRPALRDAGLPADKTTYTNAVWCHPLGNDTPGATIWKLCTACHLHPFIQQLQPKLILAAGTTAIRALLGDAKAPGVTQVAGTTLSCEGLPPIVPIYHPAYILRNDVLEPQLKQQLAYAASVYHGTLVQAPAATLNVWYPATRKDLPQLLSRIDAMRSSKVVAYDLETTGLSPWKFTTDGQPPSVLTISLASSGEDALVVPWRHPEAFGWEPQEEEAITTSLEGLLLDPAVLKGGHNVKFDDKWLNETMGIDPVQDSSVLGYANQFDTLLAHAMLDPSAPHSLDFLVRRYLFSVYGEYWRETERLASVPGGGKDYRRVPLAVLCEYNGRDSAATWALHRLFEDEVNRRGQHGLLYGHILPASQALRRLEEAGLSLDEEMLVKLLMQSYADIRATKAALMDLTSVVSWVRLHPEFNLGSVAQLAEFMYGHLQLPVVRRTKKRVPSTDAETMTMLRDDPRVSAEGHAFLTCLEEFRSASKTIGTYLTPAKGWCGDTDGLIHSTYNLHVAVTGRLSSQQPGAQQMPETMRPMFVSRWGAAGRIVSADYSGIEFRVVGCITRSKLLLEVFTNPNLDIHCMAADIMFPDLQCGVTPHKSAPQCRQCSQRKKSKGLLSFGALYGAQAPGLARKAGLTAEDAQQRLDRYFALLPEIKQYWADIVGKGRQFGYIESLFGRRRYLPDLGSKDQFLRGEAERQAINTPVQSSASDLCLAALVRLTRALEERGLRSRPIVIIHDSIVMDCPEAELGQAVPLMVAIMEDISMYPWAVVPFPVELTIGERWTK